MTGKVHKKIELVGSSQTGIEDALQNAIGFASQTLRHLEWFEVKQVTGRIADGKIEAYQVTFDVGFRMEEA